MAPGAMATFLPATSSALSREMLSRMAAAAETAVECVHDLHEAGSNLVIEALRGSEEFVEWEHYPPDDVRDPKTHAQYFFHAHAPEDREHPDYAHFHTFMGSKGMPAGLAPVEFDGYAPRSGTDGDAMSHLIAISMTPSGMPERLFTTNRWVTAETWYRAPDVIAMLDGFVVESNDRSPQINGWLTAMIVLFRPQIEQLLIERDRAVERWRLMYPGSDVFEDRRLDITSSIDISLHEHIEWLDNQLESRCSAI
jgi:hypothetical protein